ncbi:hypothetical protein WAK64_16645, partial [Bacillus spongiae]
VTYYYTIFASVEGKPLQPSNEVSATPEPHQVEAVASASKVTLEWDQVEGARLYLVGRSTTPGESTTIISGQIDPSTLTYTDTDVENGVTYYYTVFAWVEGKPLQPSNEVSATPEPHQVEAVASASKVTLEWDQVEGARLYLVGRSTTPGESTTIISGQIDPSTLTYTDTDVENGVTYYYTIFASVEGKPLQPSNEVSATPEPHQVEAVASASKVTLEWDQVEGAKLYLVGRSTTPGESTTIISGQIDPNTVTYTDTDVENGVTYYYTVFAWVEGKPLQPSNEVFATPQVDID